MKKVFRLFDLFPMFSVSYEGFDEEDLTFVSNVGGSFEIASQEEPEEDEYWEEDRGFGFRGPT